ncbi:MAG TPA: cytochrome c oxidase assembly protein [Lichenihabitans sp.]|jgi:cytochrome c oxidase assembly protein subunit 11|nr:cytochrome c oxidase assembly protein [Lichenihabitans sp.]
MRETPQEFRRRHVLTALIAFSVFTMMIGLVYASVPLYRVFCQATGYGGTPRVAEAAPTSAGKRIFNVRFDANVGAGLPWTFEPETPQITLRTGKTATVYFKVRNRSDRKTAARAEYNISPDIGGSYFDKISCFCFSEQYLGPNETAELPVVFFLDPALEQDRTMNAVDTLTLSYTFHPAKPEPAAAAAAADIDKGQNAPKL